MSHYNFNLMMNKNKILADLADLIEQNAAEIIQQNQMDMSAASGLDITLKDRLKVFYKCKTH